MTSISKTKVSILLFVVALISAWMISVPAFASETESDGEIRPLAVEYTVAFDPDDGTAYPDFFKTTVEEGGLVTETPPTPTREGYAFGGWAKSFDASDNPVLWDFATDTVQDNTTLWAVWTEATNGGGGTTEPTTGSQGPTYTQASAPTTSMTKATGSSLARTGDATLLGPLALASALGLATAGIAAYALHRKRK